MNISSKLAVLAVACLALGSGVAYAHDDMTQADPAHVKILFENDRVRVLETPLKPGEKIPMHTHAFPRVVYFSSAFSEQITRPGQEPRVYRRQAGTVNFNEPESLAVENVGTTEGRNIVVELK